MWHFMNMKMKMFYSVLLGTLVLGTILAPSLGSAQTSTVDRINALFTQIEALQRQIDTLRKAQQEAVSEVSDLFGALKEGDRGGKVKALQALLAADPEVYPEGLITGYYGKLTAKAVRNYQKKQGIEQAGVVGPKTLKKLEKELEKTPVALETVGDETRPCAIVPPGHLIAPGWLRKNAAPVVPPCQTLPPGITKKLATSTPPTDSGLPIVLAPNGGEVWQRNTTQLIRWSAPPLPTVRIDLIQTTTPCPPSATCSPPTFSVVLTTSTPNDFIFEWTVGNSLNPGVVIPDGEYAVLVSAGNGRDQSDAPFRIVTATSTPASLNVSLNAALATPSYRRGTPDVKIGSYSLLAAGDAVNLTHITLKTGADIANFTNLRLMTDGVQFGITIPNPSPNTLYSFVATLSLPLGQSKILDIRADLLYGASISTYTAPTTFQACTGSSATSGTLVTCGTIAGQTVNVTARAALGVAAAPLGATTDRAKSSADDLGTITFSADPAGTLALNTVVITFAGSAPGNADFLDGVELLNPLTGAALGSGNTTSSPCSGGSTCAKTFRLGSAANGYVLSAGASAQFTLRVNSIKTAPASAGTAQTLTALVNGQNDVQYTDGIDSAAASGIGLPLSAVPITANSVSYSTGI